MHAHPQEMAIQIRLLGRFEVVVAELQVDASGWPSTRAAQLVQLLALADGFVLPRDAVIEALWPHLEIDAGAANLRKAAHLARRALDARDAVVLRRGEVALFPQRAVTTDAVEFLSAAEAALASGDADAWRVPAAMYEGDLLPGSRLRGVDPGSATRAAHALPRRAAPRRAVGAIGRARTYRRTCASGADARRDDCRETATPRCSGTDACAPRSLRDVGVLPDAETDALYDACVAGLGPVEPAVRRPSARARPRGRRSRSATRVHRRRSLVLVRGPAGIGKSALCRQLEVAAHRAGLAPDQYQRQSRLQPVRAGRSLAGRAGRTRPAAPRQGRHACARDRRRAHVAGRCGTSPTMKTLTRHQVIGAVRRVLDCGERQAPALRVVRRRRGRRRRGDDRRPDPARGRRPARRRWSCSPTARERSPRALDRVVHVARPAPGSCSSSTSTRSRRMRPRRWSIAAAPGTARPEAVEAIVAARRRQPVLPRRAGPAESTRDGRRASGRATPRSSGSSILPSPTPRCSAASRSSAATSTRPRSLRSRPASEQDAFALLDVALAAGVIVVSDGPLPLPPRARPPGARRAARRPTSAWRCTATRPAGSSAPAPHQRSSPDTGSRGSAPMLRSTGCWPRPDEQCGSARTSTRSTSSSRLLDHAPDHPRRAVPASRGPRRPRAGRRTRPRTPPRPQSPAKARPTTSGPSRRSPSSSSATSPAPCARWSGSSP